MVVEPRSWLFIPGDNAKKLAKADGCGADAVIIDLEDSVALSNKSAARVLAADFVGERPAVARSPQMWIRVNPLASGLCEADVAAVVSARPDGIMLPKAEGPGDVERLSALIAAAGGAASIGIVAIATETPRAVFRLAGFCDQSTARLRGLTWGAEDLAAAIGASGNRHSDGRYHDAFTLARSLTLLAAHAAGVQAIDTLYPDFRDEAGLHGSSVRSRAEGFSGRLAIHPAQVAIINAAFLPAEDEIRWSQRIVDAFADAGETGTVGIDGKMIDRPHLIQAERILARFRAFNA